MFTPTNLRDGGRGGAPHPSDSPFPAGTRSDVRRTRFSLASRVESSLMPHKHSGSGEVSRTRARFARLCSILRLLGERQLKLLNRSNEKIYPICLKFFARLSFKKAAYPRPPRIPHNFEAFSRIWADLPQQYAPSGHGPATHDGPALAKSIGQAARHRRSISHARSRISH